MYHRIFSALIAIPLVLSILFFFNLFFTHLAVYILLLLLIKEFFALADANLSKNILTKSQKNEICVHKISTYGKNITFAIFSIAFWSHYFILDHLVDKIDYLNWILPVALTTAFLIISLRQTFQKKFQTSLFETAYICFVVFYSTFFALHFLKLKYVDFFLQPLQTYSLVSQGAFFLTYALCLTWSYDSAAYFSGKLLGKKTLGLAVSPNKTWMGFLGGMLSSLLVYAVFYLFLKQTFPPTNSISFASFRNPLFGTAFSLVLGLMAQLGDLVASAHKRSATLKESGNFLRGHGGVYDRIDSLLFVSLFLYYFVLAGVQL